MPSDSIDRLRDIADKAEAATAGDIAQQAMLITVRGMTDVLERVANQQDRTDAALEKIVESMHTFDKRLALIENDTLVRRIDVLEAEVKEQKAVVLKLEFAEHGRKVAQGMAGAVFKSPALGWILAGLLALLSAANSTGLVHAIIK